MSVVSVVLLVFHILYTSALKVPPIKSAENKSTTPTTITTAGSYAPSVIMLDNLRQDNVTFYETSITKSLPNQLAKSRVKERSAVKMIKSKSMWLRSTSPVILRDDMFVPVPVKRTENKTAKNQKNNKIFSPVLKLVISPSVQLNRNAPPRSDVPSRNFKEHLSLPLFSSHNVGETQLSENKKNPYDYLFKSRYNHNIQKSKMVSRPTRKYFRFVNPIANKFEDNTYIIHEKRPRIYKLTALDDLFNTDYSDKLKQNSVSANTEPTTADPPGSTTPDMAQGKSPRVQTLIIRWNLIFA